MAIDTLSGTTSAITNLRSAAASTAGATQNAATPSITAPSTTTPGTAEPVGSLKADEQSDRFLKLLVAQMRNQDPLNPLDNAAVTSQMAQISTVEGIAKLNTSLEKYLNRGSALGSLEGASLIGHRVLVKGDGLSLGALPVSGGERAAAQGGFELMQAAALTRVEILDSTGAVLGSQTMGALEAGVHTFAWDGLAADGTAAPAGKYQFRVSAGTASEQKPVTALQAQLVSAVISGQDGTRLEIGGRGQFSLSDVRAILQETKP
jgi:flagellar basal-body rod modification protein FlgD